MIWKSLSACAMIWSGSRGLAEAVRCITKSMQIMRFATSSSGVIQIAISAYVLAIPAYFGDEAKVDMLFPRAPDCISILIDAQKQSRYRLPFASGLSLSRAHLNMQEHVQMSESNPLPARKKGRRDFLKAGGVATGAL